jgi:excisionase family DNA binding protein
MAEKWITTEQAAKLSGYHVDYIRKLIRGNKIAARKWARDWQVDRANLLAYIRKVGRLGKKRGPKAGA